MIFSEISSIPFLYFYQQDGTSNDGNRHRNETKTQWHEIQICMTHGHLINSRTIVSLHALGDINISISVVITMQLSHVNS